jgi:DNA segregation ATPase FtsK/SpoIIIE-like protein
VIQWPKSLVREIARKRCIIFLGSGVSATATTQQGTSPKTWEEFLQSAKDLISDPEEKNEVEKAINEKNYLLALQAIRDFSDRADYNQLLQENFNNPAFQASGVHKAIHSLDPRIIVTTNFDKIYESYCSYVTENGAGYNTISYDQNSLGDEIRSDCRVIIKAHGSIDNKSKMIFTRSEYHIAKREHWRFYEILRSLFITNTCLFIGCSLDDPDINLLLEDVKISSSSTVPHYVLFRSNSQSRLKQKDWEDTYNIKALEYGENFEDLQPALEGLTEQVIEFRSTHPEP